MAWRVARSLNQLLEQINTAYPGRSRASDGSIGDTAHQNRTSDHNPWYGPGIVTARDFTHDPSAGFDAHAFAERLRQARDPRIKYVISNGRIFSATVSPWTWRKYAGSNPHTKHVHVSVVADPRCDDARPWAGVTATTSSTVGSRIPDFTNEPEDDMTPEQAKQLAFIAERVKYLDAPVSKVDEAAADKVLNGPTSNGTSLANNVIAVRKRTDPYLDAPISAVGAALGRLTVTADVDVKALATEVKKGLGDGLAKQFVQELANQLGGK